MHAYLQSQVPKHGIVAFIVVSSRSSAWHCRMALQHGIVAFIHLSNASVVSLTKIVDLNMLDTSILDPTCSKTFSGGVPRVLGVPGAELSDAVCEQSKKTTTKQFDKQEKNEKKRKTYKHSSKQPNEHTINPTKRTAKKEH